jgi:toxin YoeB
MNKLILSWDKDAWEDYLYWRKTDKKILKRINRLILDTLRNPFEGIGKPEMLKEDLSGYMSKRIDHEYRLIYCVYTDRLHILQCRYHY